MHLLNNLFLSKTFVLEIRNEMVRENKTFGNEKMVRRENHEKRMVRERNSERKKWSRFMVFLRVFFTFPTFLGHMYVIGYRFGI